MYVSIKVQTYQSAKVQSYNSKKVLKYECTFDRGNSDGIAGNGDVRGLRLFLPFYPFTFLPFLKFHHALLFPPRIIERERKGRLAVIEGTAYHRNVVTLQGDTW